MIQPNKSVHLYQPFSLSREKLQSSLKEAKWSESACQRTKQHDELFKFKCNVCTQITVHKSSEQCETLWCEICGKVVAVN